MKYLRYIIVIAIVLAAYYLISPLFRVIEVNEDFPVVTINKMEDSTMEPKIITSSDFIPSKHEVEGSAVLIEYKSDRILRFENFETVNGPNLHIYLASDKSAEDFVDLGPIKATRGNVNYEIPEDVDLEKYNTVLVYCVPFKVVFSFAELQI